MQQRILVVILLITVVVLSVFADVRQKVARQGTEPTATNLASPLTGTWQAIEAELGGKPFPAETVRSIKLVLSAHDYQVGNDFGTYEFDPTVTPAAMTIRGTKGPNQGKTILAIYELAGDTLRICYDLTGQKRPTAFATEPGTRQFLARYKREEAK